MKKNLVLMLVAMFLMSCIGEHSDRAVVSHHVIVVNPVASNGSCVKRLAGHIREASQINVAFKTPGQLIEINVKEGDYVRAGQLLARLDDSDYKLGVEAYQLQYDQLSEEVNRLRALHDAKTISGNDFEKAETGLKQLAVQLQANKNKVAYTRLYAPCDGYIQKVNFEKTEMVDAGTPVFSLLDTKHFEVELMIPNQLLAQQQDFGAIEGCVSLPGENLVFPLSLLSISPKADANQLYSTRLLVKAPAPKQLCAGMNVEVRIGINGDSGVGELYAVPLHAVFDNHGVSCVWVLGSDSVVSAREVKYQHIDEHGNAVVSGVSGDDRVVKAGVECLTEGEKVIVIDKASERNVGGLI